MNPKTLITTGSKTGGLTLFLTKLIGQDFLEEEFCFSLIETYHFFGEKISQMMKIYISLTIIRLKMT